MTVTYENDYSVKEAILQNLKTTLEGIAVADGYRVDVQGVYRFRIAPWDVVTPALSIVGVREDKTPIEGYPPRMDVQLTCIVTGLVSQDPVEDSEELHNALMLDVEAAVQVDTSRGGYALDTTVVGTDVELGFDDRPFGVDSVVLRIRYQHGRADPTKAYT